MSVMDEMWLILKDFMCIILGRKKVHIITRIIFTIGIPVMIQVFIGLFIIQLLFWISDLLLSLDKEA